MVRFQSSVSSESGVILWLNPECFRDASQIFSAYGRKPGQVVLDGQEAKAPGDIIFYLAIVNGTSTWTESYKH